MSDNEAIILEFDNDIRHCFRDALRDQGYHARFFASVKDVTRDWPSVRSARFYVIAGDVPGDGLEVLKKVRKEATHPDSPVLFILDDKSEARVKSVIAERPDAVLLRPYTVKDIVSRVGVLASAA